MASDWTDLQSSNPGDVGYGGTNVDVWTLAGTSAAQSLPSVENLLESNLLFGSAETFGPGVSTFMTAASAGDTFSGTADHPIAVKVSGSSNGSADLSTQAESKAASAQLVTDPAVQSTSATSNAVSLATDSSLQPSLSVDAANPAHVTFTVSGLEPDYSGTVTFTDPSGTQDVVPIESNGAYSANLSNLTNGTITYLLSVSDPAGNVITVDPPLNLGDGSANAPAGTPQLPNLLSGYAATPSWNVAGVNYYVGDPAGTTLKNPDTINMAGVTVDTSTDVVTITGNNITLSGYDFSLNGGWQVYVAGNNDTIEDCNFEVGSNGQAPISIGVNGQTASNTTIEYNTINGNGISVGGGGLIECSGIGTTTIEYNSITNAYNEAIVLGNTTSSAANYVVQYNLIENTGLGYTEGAHGDWIQTFNAPGDTSSIEINYNTFVQNVAGQSTQGLSLQSANITQGPVLSETVENNTMVALDSGTVNYAIIVDTTNLNGSATVANNYIGPTGLTYGWSFFGQYNNPDGSYNGTLTSFNNVDMATGAYYPQSGTTAPQFAALRAAIQNDVHDAVVSGIENDVGAAIQNDVHDAVVSGIENDVRAAIQNDVHDAVVARLVGFIASSFAEASVSHGVNIVSDALQTGNLPLLTNPHHT